jgi:hypothetical protein
MPPVPVAIRIVGNTANADARYLKLDASNDPLTGDLVVNGSASLVAASSPLLGYRYSADAGGAYIELHKSRNATPGSQTIVQTGDVLGGLIWRGSDGTAFRDAGYISLAVDGTPGASDMPTRIDFWVAPDGSAIPTRNWQMLSTGLTTGFAMDHIKTSSVSGVSTQSIDGCFTSTYAAYFIYHAWSHSTNAAQFFRLRASGVDNVSANYYNAINWTTATAVGGVTGNAANTAATIFTAGTAGVTHTDAFCALWVVNPAAAASKSGGMVGWVTRAGDNNYGFAGGWRLAVATAMDGISFLAGAGTFTGTTRIYGLRN